ncbi:MAG: Fe-S cluster assembly protein SufD [Pseudomonadota bacterium]|nr:Fe-S cluster assembly protein SufD [Pseudomonadota bacterium]
MITLEKQRSWFEQQLAAGSTRHTGENPQWLQLVREDAIEAAAQLPLHNRSHEAWRYTSIEGLLRASFAGDAQAHQQDQAVIDDLLLPDFDSYRLVLVNGEFNARLSSCTDLPPGVRVESLRTALHTDTELLANWFGSTANHSESIFSALNTALINDGFFIHIDQDIELQRPIEVVYVNSGLNPGEDQQLMMHPRNLVVLQPGAKATLVERFVGTIPSRYFHNNLTEISLQQNATLKHYRLQDESRDAWHLSSISINQQSHSDYRGVTLAFGGAWARTEYHLDFDHEHATCGLSGLYTVGDKQLTDFHLTVKHRVADCRSREQFKGILYGGGRAVFDGHILVDKDAQRSDAQLSNDNLMLTRNAEVDTKPQLEIYADDVKCSHGTTIGQLDPQQLFYMRSRGIDEATARSMLCQGFAAEIIGQIDLPPLRKHATEILTNCLKQASKPEDGR